MLPNPMFFRLMKCMLRPKGLFRTALVLAGAWILSAAPGQTAGLDEFDSLYERDTWFVRVGARPLFGVKGSVERAYPTSQNQYDDGFVQPDINGSDSQQTWYWGYKRNSQINGDRLWLSRQRGEPMAGFFNDESDDPSIGLEAMGGIEMFRFEISDRMARVGFELGYGYNLFSVENQSTASSMTTLSSDGYNLGDTDPPSAPYQGTKKGPGPLIDLYPSISASITTPGQTYFDGELEANLHTVKLGFWFQYMLSQRASINASLGYATIYADTRLIYDESFYFDDPRLLDRPPVNNTIGDRTWKPGAYLQLRFHYHFTRHLGAFLGGELQYNTSFEFTEAERTVSLDLGPLYAALLGLEVRF
jgi:hypothetical protein